MGGCLLFAGGAWGSWVSTVLGGGGQRWEVGVGGGHVVGMDEQAGWVLSAHLWLHGFRVFDQHLEAYWPSNSARGTFLPFQL